MGCLGAGLILFGIVVVLAGGLVLAITVDVVRHNRRLVEEREEAIELRLRQLKSPDVNDRVNAARALRDFPDEPRALRALEAARDDPENEVSWSVADSIAVIRDPVFLSERGFPKCRRCNMFMKPGQPDDQGVLMSRASRELCFCPQCGLVYSSKERRVLTR